MSALPALDLSVLGLYVVATVALGMFAGRGARGVSDFAVGGRDLPAWALTLSLVATETSTVTFLSVPSVAFRGDLTFLQIPLGYVIGRLAVALLLVPAYFRGEVFTAYEVLGRRFGGLVKPVASCVFLVARNLSDGLRLFLGGVVLQATLGFDLWLSVSVLGVLTIAYTFVGGIRAVVWMDVLQFFVYVGGALLAGWTILRSFPNGFADVWAAAGTDGRFDLFEGKTRLFDLDFSLGSASFLGAGLIGGAFLSLATHGADQMMVQRYLCARDRRAAQACVVVSSVVVVAQFALFLLLGTMLYAWFQRFEAASEPGKDHELATYVVEHLRTSWGAAGIVLGAVFAASMSTLSSSLNSSAVAVVRDVLGRTELGSPGEDRAQLGSIRRWTVVFGVVQIAVGIGAQWLDGSVVSAVLAIAGFTSGLLLGLFLLALFVPAADARAALIALAVGAAGMLSLFIVTQLTSEMPGVQEWLPAWPWYAMLGSMGTFGVGWWVSRGSSGRPPPFSMPRGRGGATAEVRG